MRMIRACVMLEGREWASAEIRHKSHRTEPDVWYLIGSVSEIRAPLTVSASNVVFISLTAGSYWTCTQSHGEFRDWLRTIEGAPDASVFGFGHADFRLRERGRPPSKARRLWTVVAEARVDSLRRSCCALQTETGTIVVDLGTGRCDVAFERLAGMWQRLP